MNVNTTAIAFMSCIVVTVSFNAGAAEFKTGDRLEISGNYSDNLFASGGQIDASLQSEDDVFLAGGRVHFTGRTTENLWIAGGDLLFQDAQFRDGVFAGGDISIDGARLRELIAAGGKIRIRKSEIKDDLVAAGGELWVDSETTVRGTAVLSGGIVTLAGRFSGDVEVYSQKLKLDSTAVIGGNLIHSAESIEIVEGARVQGRTVEKPVERKRWAGPMGVIGGILFLVGSLLVVPVIVTLFPRSAEGSREQIRERFWECLGRGALVALAAPIVWIFLVASVVGSPLALVLLPFLIAAWILAWSVAVYTLADRLRGWVKKGELGPELSSRQRFGWTFLASFLVSLVIWIPFLGFVVALVTFLAGLGAIYVHGKNQLAARSAH